MMMDYALCVLSERPVTSNISNTPTFPTRIHKQLLSFRGQTRNWPLYSHQPPSFSLSLALSLYLFLPVSLTLTLFLSSLHPPSLSLLFLVLSVSNPFSLSSLSSSLPPLWSASLQIHQRDSRRPAHPFPPFCFFTLFPQSLFVSACQHILGKKKGLGTVKLGSRKQVLTWEWAAHFNKTLHSDTMDMC